MPEDLDLDPRPLPPRAPRPSRAPLVLTLLALLGLAGGLFYWMGSRRGRPEEQVAPRTASAPAPQTGAGEPAAVPRAEPPLPELDASDAFTREHLAALSAEPSWARWLAADGLISRFVAAVSAVSDGKSPRQALDHLPVSGVFGVRVQESRMLVDAASFARYDAVARVLKSIDPAAARPVWRLLHPLLERAWAEISPPGRELDAVVLAAIDHLLATPLPPAEIEVYPADGLYRYVDPALEALSPAQKHLLRMGASNAFEVREALRRLRGVVAG